MRLRVYFVKKNKLLKHKIFFFCSMGQDFFCCWLVSLNKEIFLGFTQLCHCSFRQHPTFLVFFFRIVTVAPPSTTSNIDWSSFLAWRQLPCLRQQLKPKGHWATKYDPVNRPYNLVSLAAATTICVTELRMGIGVKRVKRNHFYYFFLWWSIREIFSSSQNKEILCRSRWIWNVC